MNNKPKSETTIAEKLQNSMRQIGQIVYTRKFWVELIIMSGGTIRGKGIRERIAGK